MLRFDLDDVLGRREDHTLKAAAALLHRECLLPEQGASLLDSLDDNSHKHAFAVSEDLKYALRESIELIGNEAIWYLREVARDRVYRLDDALAGELGLQALRYMYRLLFLFYIEARPDLGYAPIEAEAYRKGYGLERLRDLEMVRLTSEESLDGYYLHHSIQTLFRLIRDGFEGPGGDLFAPSSTSSGPRTHGFTIRALDSRLFRDDAMPLPNRVKLRNRVLQKVIRLMSLSRPAKGRRGRRGRISYAQLGINQLGAVYESLLSYRGFFAEEDLYEVKKAGDVPDDLASAWFVPARDLGEYREEEKVYDRDDQGRKKLRVHPKGTFVYRLSGRDRQKSASYYTPESLTRCVVKYALKELIPDDMPADRILDLTVCEPAMGSAAFLNEAVNQLSEKYLDRKQGELGQRIPHADYTDELQKVRHYIADRNVYGVDLNPVALELAEVSLWLNCIHKDGRVPWFGYQLMRGNSLVGARRQVFESGSLGKENKRAERWFNRGAGTGDAGGSGSGGGGWSGRGGCRGCGRSDGSGRSEECGVGGDREEFRPGSGRRTGRPRPAPVRHRLSLPPAGPRHGGLPRQGGEGRWSPSTWSGSGNGGRSSASRSPMSRSPSWKRCRTAWTSCGPRTRSNSPAITARPRTRFRCGASPCLHASGAPPTHGRTASALRASSAKAPAPRAPTGG